MLKLCQFASCNSEGDLPILITDTSTDPASRVRFCCYAHAIGWLLGRVNMRGSVAESARLAIQGIVTISDQDYSGRVNERTFGPTPNSEEPAHAS